MLTLILCLVFLLILLCGSGFLNIILFKKAELQLSRSEIHETWIIEFRKDVEHIYNSMKDIDNRQMFEKDDDVGVIFQEMVELINKLNSRSQDQEEIER